MVEVGSKRTNYEFTADGQDADGQKKPRPDGDKLRLLVLGRYAGSLIGKGGENFQRLREKYNVKITGLSSRANERVVQLDGPRSDCLGIVSELLPLCPIGRYPSGSGKNTFEVNILANTDAVGMLIGKGGTKIKEIKEQTNTKINVYPECLPNSNERVVALGGENEEVVVKGMEFVLGILDSAPRRSATVFFRPDQLEGKQLSIPDISGKGMGATNTTNTLPTVSNNNNNKGSTPQLPNNNQSDIQNIAALLVAQRNTKQQNGFDATFDFGSAETVTTLTLNNDICGAIIGQGGQNIRYIKEVSGAQVDMTKSDGGSDRTLTMRGNQDQIQIAEQLMAQCVRASKRGGQQQPSPPQQQQQQEQQQQMQQQPWDQPQQHHHQPWQQQQQQQQQQGHWQQQQHMHNPATMQLQQQMHQPPAQQHHQPWNQPW